MATSRPFAYNPGLSAIVGATLVVNSPLSIGVDDQVYTLQPGGIQWWQGPDEDLGYVIAHSVPSGDQPNPLNIPAYLGFWRSENLSEITFYEKAGSVSNKTYTTGNEAYIWMNGFGYWSSWPINPGSLYFAGNNINATINPTNMSLGDTFTIEFWYYGDPTSTGGDQFIFSQGGSLGGLSLWIEPGDKCLHGLSTSGTISASLPVNVLVHVAIVCSNGTISVYFDGVDKTAGGIPPCNLGDNITTVYLGSRTATSRFLEGLLTDIRITTTTLYLSGFQVPTSSLLPIQNQNPYGGVNTNSISNGECKLLIGALSSTNFTQDLSNIGSTVTNGGIVFDNQTPY
jgi:hypothetical protein